MNYKLKGVSIDDLYNKPKITNEHVKWEIKLWSEVNPANYLHLYKTMEEIKFSKKNNLKMSLDKYNQAIELAKENLWYKDQALANELACKLLIENNMNIAALGYFNESIRLYSR